jgi:hypothetical protein
VDESNRDHEAMLPAALGAPHPDALALDYAVRRLDPVTIQWPMARAVLAPDVGACVRDRDPAVHRMQVEPGYLIRHHAIMGTRPTWHLGAVRLVRTIGKNGKPLVEGITAGRRYADGAHCPLQLEPSAAAIVSARFEYLAWWSALVTLARESWILKDHAPQHPRATQAPWLTGPQRTPRILPTVTPRKISLTMSTVGAC